MTAPRRTPARWRWGVWGKKQRELWRGDMQLAKVWRKPEGWAWWARKSPTDELHKGIEYRMIEAEQAAKAALR